MYKPHFVPLTLFFPHLKLEIYKYPAPPHTFQSTLSVIIVRGDSNRHHIGLRRMWSTGTQPRSLRQVCWCFVRATAGGRRSWEKLSDDEERTVFCGGNHSSLNEYRIPYDGHVARNAALHDGFVAYILSAENLSLLERCTWIEWD